MMNDVAVVILNFNGRHFLAQFLPSVCAYSGQARVIVADNASTDESVSYLKQYFPDVELIVFEKNYGFAGGYNEALKRIEARYYAIINSDVDVTAQWLDPLVEFLETHPDYASVQPKIRAFHHKEAFEYAGAAGGFVDTLGYPYCRGRLFNAVELDQGQYDNVIDVDWTSGACMVIRQEVYHSLGGFDEDFFAHMEEIDLCWRMRSAGWKLGFVPTSTVFHVGGGTLHASSPRKTYLNFKNGLSLLLKNLPVYQLIWKLPLRLVLDGIAAMKFAFETSPNHLLAILKAHWAFYRGSRRDWVKRQKTSPARSMSVVWAYYMKKRQKFSSLDQ